ncbi:DUF465 domain-containing protein [uncultured Gammaproteobacteria bacterium]
MTDQQTLYQTLTALRGEHRELDELIAGTVVQSTCDQIDLQRLKKRKLWLKDQIIRIENMLLPDIIA